MANVNENAVYFLNSETQVNITTTSASTSETTTTTVNKNLTYNTGQTLENAMKGFKNLYNALSTESVNNVDLTLNKEYTDLLTSDNVNLVDDSGTVITSINVTFTPKSVQGASGIYLGGFSVGVDAPEDCVVFPIAVHKDGRMPNNIGGIIEAGFFYGKVNILLFKLSNDTSEFQIRFRVLGKANWISKDLSIHPIIQEG